jgi:hypothetical protein
MMKLPKFPFNIPWFMFDLSNYQLITSRTIPSDIRDTKSVVLTEAPVPGLNYQPVIPGGGGNRKLSFTLPLIMRDNYVGNVLVLKQIDALRNQSLGLLGAFASPGTFRFNSNPKVLYYWGTGSVPLVYWVAKADATHKMGWVNASGQPQYSEIEFELILDEEDPIYQQEVAFRSLAGLVGSATGLLSTLSQTNQGAY